MIRVISFKICPFVQRVTALLEAQHTPYEIEYISLKDKPAWFQEISPTEQVPVLVTDTGQALFESDAIVEYLNEVYGPIEPELTPEQRAFDRAWSYQGSKQYLAQCTTMRSDDKETLLERTEKLGSAFEKAEKAIDGGPFFKGESLSSIDIAWLPLLHRASIIEFHTGYDLIAKYPKVKAWQSAVMQTGIPEKSVATDFEEAFTGFYLSNSTFLGNPNNCTNEPDVQCKTSACC